MHHEVKFKGEREAMIYALQYNPKGVKAVLRLIKQWKREGAPYDDDVIRMAFAFVGVQGYPVTCFIERYRTA